MKIEFRGKRTDNGKWVYGYYYYDCGNDKALIISRETMPSDGGLRTVYNTVIFESVGQFIDVKDIKNVKVYKGDIVKCVGFQKKEFVAEIVWRKETCCFELWNCTKGGGDLHEFINSNADHEDFGIWTLEVIGNKTNNPELLK